MDHLGTEVTALLQWRRRGLIVAPPSLAGPCWTHAQLPVPVLLAGSELRIFFAARAPDGRSHVAFVDATLNVADETLRAGPARIALPPGPRGTFDGDGLYPSSLVRTEGCDLLYTIGWNAGTPAPLFYASIGLARASTLENFVAEPQPILARSAIDPFLVTGPCVLFDQGRYRMWYVSGLGWVEEAGKLASRYHLRYAESTDGMRWNATGRVCIDLLKGETNISRPWISKENGLYHCWFSVNAGYGYRIGYADSPDGLAWTRRNAGAGLDPMPGEFDSEAQAYPAVLRHADRWWMFYNGNAFGRAGIGLAVADVD